MMSKIFPQSVEEFGKDWGELIGKLRIYVADPSVFLPMITQIRNVIYANVKIPENYHGHVDTIVKVMFYIGSFIVIKTMVFLLIAWLWFFGFFIFIGILACKAYLVHISGTKIEPTIKFGKGLITELLTDANQYGYVFVKNFQISYNKVVADNANKVDTTKTSIETTNDVNQTEENKKLQ